MPVTVSSVRTSTADANYDAAKAVDGITDSITFGSVYFASTDFEPNPWLRVDLQQLYHVTKAKIWARSDCCGGEYTTPIYRPGSFCPFDICVDKFTKI